MRTLNESMRICAELGLPMQNEKIIDMLERARVVATLDAWTLREFGRWWDVDSDAPGLACVLHGQAPDADWNFEGATFDAARAAAAKAIENGEV